MDGEQDATQTEDQQQEQQGDQAQQEAGQDAQAHGPEAVGAEEYQKALAAKDARISELQGKVTAAAKTAEATEALNAEIAQLKQQMTDKRTEFALRAAGARSVKAAKALLSDHDGDIQALWRPSRGCSRTRLHKGPHKPAGRPGWNPPGCPAARTPPA